MPNIELNEEDLALLLAGRLEIHPHGKFYFDEFGGLHREDGPAHVGNDGTLLWFHHGRQHRVGGPAAIHPSGEEIWYIDGVRTGRVLDNDEDWDCDDS